MAKNNSRSTPQNNSEVSYGPCRPDEYLSPAARGSMVHTQESILAANARARLAEKDMCASPANTTPMSFDSTIYEVRRRYRARIVDAGNSTYTKSPDKIY